ncbi:MAG: peptide chain release factor N(5)-glutamine methyltransferase [Elusimicrobiota bacterium]|jgi:release factor glutamine methyltransferase|nr:peptide chain release factor N(5)-glutamine methyltransferase [Elusimicrobiota bacterium]
MMTIRELIESGTKKLEAARIGEAQTHCEFIAAFVLNKSRTYVRAFGQNIVYDKERAMFDDILKEKLAGRPLAHITGSAEFMGRIFDISQTVLIPRPETEELVEQAIKKISVPPRSVLDICTGSGCIAISLAFLFKSAKIVSADISKEALKVALRNAQNLNIANRIEFIESDMFDKLGGTFDFIISNPPYIPEEIISTLSPEVQCEPHIALCGGKDGLSVIKRLISSAPKYLNPGGLLALEIGCAQAEKVVKFFKDVKWQKPQIGKDISGTDRFVFARRK